MYNAICNFGGFVVGIGFIVYASCAIVNMFNSRKLERDEEQRTREYYRKRGEL